MIENVPALSELINSGISLIPIKKSNKSPYATHKGKENLTLVKLIDAIRYYDQNSEPCSVVAIRCGLLSGGLICLDVDSKHKPGFSERIIFDLKEIHQSIWEKLVVDKTPSGGLHIYYKVSLLVDEFPRSSDLASRYCTEEEIAIRPDLKKRCFLEIKADGGLSQCFPSEGYERIKGTIISEIDVEEHQILIAFCKAYDEIIKIDAVKIKTSFKDNYQTGKTPFDCFNNSSNGARVLEDLGWGLYASGGSRNGLMDGGRLIGFTKPGAKKSYFCGAIFNLKDRYYKIFTTGTDLDSRGYNPSSLLCEKKFGNNWSDLYAHLVSEGYGELKPFIEENQIRKALKTGVDLPKNISEKAKADYDKKLSELNKKYPYGEFWSEEKESSWKISREDFYNVSKELGFRCYKNEVVYIDGYKIKIVSERFYYDKLKEYIGADANLDLINTYEEFLQKSGKFSIGRLSELNMSLILRSTKSISYKFYSNVYLRIDKDGYELLEYTDLEYLIWETDIKNRDFKIIDEFKTGLYWDFIQNAIGWSSYTRKCIGYYAHDHRDEEGYFIIATEKVENPRDGGGSGKNIFCNLFELITTYKSVAASLINFNNNLLQSWDGQRIFCIADIPKKFDIIFFKDIITGNAVVNKKYINEYSIAIEDMCKIIGSSNYSFDDADPGIKRRVRALEFSDYYTKNGGVKKVTGKMFPKDWDENEYLLFDNLMVCCICDYLIGNNTIDINEMSDTGWIKKFDIKYTHIYDFIKTNIESWIELGRVSNSKFNSDYESFRKEYNVKSMISSHTINNALTEYCNHHKINFDFGEKVIWKEAGLVIRGRLFGNSVKSKIEEVKEELPF